ncbi:exonuclease SbcCD subunit D [Rhodococcus sp. WMMA185]|uniref:exonuclease SbcCD subunit D n=1 Tax=Rhodococcus sp. WMMA185 TaxID=679318 RepID=UPI000877EBDF|nr:exonuclease SbcCD subunit D [Rhodococcus sp. WMMA185]AOW91917.1 exonuclease SbcCD subunit D [Rhodococcus sp. WMMA185]
MRILHTSDWHIGRTFHGVDLLADQACALDAIAAVVAERSVDVVVVPGDVYDRSIPSADAVTVCNRGLEAIRDAGAVIVATSGNHDSAARLGAGAAFSRAGGLHLMTTVAGIGSPVILEDEYGPVAFYGIPYLEPEITRDRLGVPSARSHAEILDAAMGRVRADLDVRRQTLARTRSVLLAHAFVVGAEPTGSERSISVGGVETVPASAFEGVDYVALGHLHSPQTLAENIRYSGSPLPYSFGERTHDKAVFIVEMDADGLRAVERVALPVVRGLRQLTGTVRELLENDEYQDAEDCYVSAVLTDPERPIDAMRALQTRFPFAVHLEWQRPEGSETLRYRDKIRGRSDLQITRSFLADVRSDPSPGEVRLVEAALGFADRAGERTAEVGAMEQTA